MIAMKYYTSTTEFNCGIDLHARQMYVCVLDRTGKKLVHTNIKNNDFAYFLKLVAPYRRDLTVCAECMFGWYGLADACADAGLHFVLAHALDLKSIHGGKNKNDRIETTLGKVQIAEDLGRTSIWHHQTLVRLHALFAQGPAESSVRMEPHDAGLQP